jgi:hypothetical protein
LALPEKQRLNRFLRSESGYGRKAKLNECSSPVDYAVASNKSGWRHLFETRQEPEQLQRNVRKSCGIVEKLCTGTGELH